LRLPAIDINISPWPTARCFGFAAFAGLPGSLPTERRSASIALGPARPSS
jgi:hypothetical protein